MEATAELSDTVYNFLVEDGDQSCCQIIVGLDLIGKYEHDAVEATLDALVTKGRLRRYAPEISRKLHEENLREGGSGFFFYGVPRPKSASLRDLFREYFPEFFRS